LFAMFVIAQPSSRAKVKKGRVFVKKPSSAFNEIHFKKLTGYKVALDCASQDRFFIAGDLPKLTFRLTNLGKKDLLVYEWYERENSNIRLYYYKLDAGMDSPPPLKEFTPIIPMVGDKPARMTLDLKPKTSVLISTFLTFVRVVQVKKATTFLLFAELNMKSISARSKCIRIVVLPRGGKRPLNPGR